MWVVDALHLREVVRLVAGVDLLFVHDGHILAGIEHRRLAGHVLPTVIGIETDLCLTLTTIFGGHEHHTIGSLSTIDGSRGGILQHIDTLDIGRIQSRDVATNTIDQIEGTGTAYGTETTNLNLPA